MDNVQPFLDAVNQHIGYERYKVRRSAAQNGNWCIDVYDANGMIRVHAERIGSKAEIEMFIRGMFQMIPSMEMYS